MLVEDSIVKEYQYFGRYIILLMRLIFRSRQFFAGLDHSNLSSSITTEGNRNYKINLEKGDAIDGYITSNQDAKHVVIMIHEWWGFNKSIAKTADKFASKQLRVFVPDLYRGKPAINAEVLILVT